MLDLQAGTLRITLPILSLDRTAEEKAKTGERVHRLVTVRSPVRKDMEPRLKA